MIPKDIEVEIRSFLTDERFEELLQFFQVNGEFTGTEDQETWYWSGDKDLRTQKSDTYSKIWMKDGKMHDTQRKEIELKITKDDFSKANQLFEAIGLTVKIKWFRRRSTFNWQDITVTLDKTRGYGHIIELEKMCVDNDKEKALSELTQKINELKITATPKEEFDKRFKDYQDNWKNLTNE